MYSLRLRCSQLNVLISGAYSQLNILNFSVHRIYMTWKAPQIDRRRQFVESLKKARSADRVLIPKSPSTRRHISAASWQSSFWLSAFQICCPSPGTHGDLRKNLALRVLSLFLREPTNIKSAHARFAVLP